jgi:hypothetical protein
MGYQKIYYTAVSTLWHREFLWIFECADFPLKFSLIGEWNDGYRG